VRAGIQSIDPGQMRAARSLGMSYAKAMRRIILPQALRRVLPPMTNEALTLLKNTALVSTIALADLLRSGLEVMTWQANTLQPPRGRRPVLPGADLAADWAQRPARAALSNSLTRAARIRPPRRRRPRAQPGSRRRALRASRYSDQGRPHRPPGAAGVARASCRARADRRRRRARHARPRQCPHPFAGKSRA